MTWLKPRRSRDHEIDAEIAAHVAERTDDLIAQGLAPGDARSQAQREFGNVTLIAGASREVWRVAWLDGLTTDLRFAVRTLRRSPVFTSTAILCLALGIGANTAVFTVIDRVILRPLPYPGADRIVTIGRVGLDSSESPRRFAFWQTQDLQLENLTAFQASTATITGIDQPQALRAILASRLYFPLFGAQPILGRTFSEEEDRPGGPCAAVLSYGTWQRYFGADPSSIGRSITLDGKTCSIAGVLPSTFVSYPEAAIWIPLQLDPATNNQASFLTAAARLPAGATIAQARIRLNEAHTRYQLQFPSSVNPKQDTQVAPFQDKVTGDVGPLLLLLSGAVALVLLIACTNVANLLLARAAAREKEFAIRAAIGAGRARLVRQLTVESLLLSLSGSLAGLLCARLLLGSVLQLAPGELPRFQEVSSTLTLDPRILLFTLTIAVVSGIGFGLVPALRASRTALTDSLKESGTRSSAGPRHARILSLLTSSEVALAVVLLSTAILLIRSFAAMHSLTLGFDPTGILTMQAALLEPRYSNPTAVDRLARTIVERLELIPGIESAAVASALPLFGKMDMIFDIPGRPPQPDRPFTGDVQWRYVTAGYFRTLRIPLLRGRYFRDQEPRPVIIISSEMARRFWPDRDPIGQSVVLGPRLGPGFEIPSVEVIGVAGDVRERFDHEAGAAIFYMPPGHIPDRALALLNRHEETGILLRTRPGVSPQSLAAAAQQELGSMLPVFNIRTMQQAGIDSTPRHNFRILLLGLLAAIATLLAAIGIYGVMAYGVTQRTREIGIRAALGATPAGALRFVLRRACAIAAAGIAIGTVAALAVARLMASQLFLFGITPADPVTFVAVPALLAGVALIAAIQPALRASRVDPVRALRAE